MVVLGIETSCDETSVAVVEDGRRVRSNLVYTQIAKHRPYGGVVPEIACRCHAEALPAMLGDALAQAGATWTGVDRVAVTAGPGLASSLLVGVSAAHALAMRLGKPLVRVNHMVGHLYSMFLGDGAPRPADALPALVLLVSGGHTSLVLFKSFGDYELLGQTLDDAAGEALDKGAKLLGLGYPGGPVIDRMAQGGRTDFVTFPRGTGGATPAGASGELDPSLCFSFSGLKTALLYYLKSHPDTTTDGTMPDVVASYQEAVVDALMKRIARAVKRHPVRALACGGGVARNRRLRDKLTAFGRRNRLPVHLSAPEFCTDNAAMIAAAAGAGLGYEADPAGPPDVKPSWPIGWKDDDA